MSEVWKVYQANVLPNVASRLPDLKPSRHRSKRVRKKLLRKFAEPVYGAPQVWVISEGLRRVLAGEKL